MTLDIIAEVGSVHDGSFGNACKLIELAKAVGATTVKFQMHLPEFETTRDAPSPSYFKAEPRFEYFRRTGFEPAQWQDFLALAQEIDIDFCCSPFSLEALDLLLEIGVKKIKIASGEVTNLPLLRAAGERAPQVIVSSGMSDWAELDAAVEAVRAGGKAELSVLQCSSQYPCAPDNVGLNVIAEMAKRYECKVGFSDHTLGMAAPIGAIFHGADIIEKHLTFSKAMYGSDAKHSMEPEEFSQLAAALQEAYVIHHHPVSKDSAAAYHDMKAIFEKSLVAASDLAVGTVLEARHIGYKKPASGMKPSQAELLIGRRLLKDVKADHFFSLEDVA